MEALDLDLEPALPRLFEFYARAGGPNCLVFGRCYGKFSRREAVQSIFTMSANVR